MASDAAPFSPAAMLHPPGALPKGVGIAMDEGMSATSAWANGIINGAFAEGMTFMGYAELALLAQRPEYRRMVETIARHMTRKWIEFKTTGDDNKADKIKKIETALTNLKAQSVFQRAAEQDGYFGRGHIYIDTGDGENPAELKTSIGNGSNAASKAKVRRGGINALRNVEAVWCYPTQYNSSDPLSPNWYKPNGWFVLGKELDRSRLLTLISREVPDLLKPAYSFGGLALTQMAKPYVDNWLRTRQSVADIISAFSVMVLETNLIEQINVDNGEQLFKRAELFNNLRDNRGLMMIDKNSEGFQNVSAPLSGLEALQAQTQEHMSAVSGIPLVELLGIQPAGLNATSEGEITVFDDWIHSCQEQLFRDPLTTIINFVQLSEFGAIDPDIGFEFCPLRSLDDKERGEVNRNAADTDNVYVEMGAVDAEEVRQRLIDDPDSPYKGLDPNKMPKRPDAPTPSVEELLGGGKPKEGAGGAEVEVPAEGAAP